MLILSYFFYKSLVNFVAQQYHYEISINETDSIFNIANNVTNELEKYRIFLLDKDSTLGVESGELDSKVDSKDIDSSNLDSNVSETFKEDSIESKNTESNNILENNLEISQDSNIEIKEDSIAENNIESKEDSKIESANLDSNKVTNFNTFNQKSSKGWEIKNDKLYIKKGANFLLIGDSLMQGIGFALNKDLRNAGFKVKNIAKQSTGLVLLKSFNWIKEAKNAFKQNPQIAVLVVCLGMNDGWDIWDSGTHKFGSAGWIDVYGSRVQEIIDVAKGNNAALMWFEVPAVKKESLNNKLKVLNEIFREKVRENGGIFISSENILQDSKYVKFLKDSSGKSVQVRADDNIHFTKSGAKILSDSLFSHLEIIESSSQDSKPEIINIESKDKDKLIESIINRNKKLGTDSKDSILQDSKDSNENSHVEQNQTDLKNIESDLKNIESNENLNKNKQKDSINLENLEQKEQKKSKKEIKEIKNIESNENLEKNDENISKDALKNHPFFNNIE